MAPAAPPGPELDALLARIARPAPARVAFVDVRWSGLLARPLVTAGELEYRGGERLTKRVDRPYRETTEIDGRDVRVRREGQTPRRFSLDRAPELRGMLASFAGLLAGDRKSLEAYFEAAVIGARPASATRAGARRETSPDGDVSNPAFTPVGDSTWTITLAPKSERLAKRVATIEMQGRGNVPRCVWVREPDGDATLSLLGAAGAAPVPRDATREALAQRCI
jgi:hypothetical protein